jgi:hypothetical protein
METTEDPLAAARGIANGLCIGMLMWVATFLLAGTHSLFHF